MMSFKRHLSIVGVLAACGTASAQSFNSNFESPTYSGSAAGTVLTGQDGWYLPSVGGLDHNVFTQVGNALGMVANPSGDGQFEGGLGGTNVARAQHAVDFSSGGKWKFELDCNGLYSGVLPAINNIGSFSLQPTTTVPPARYFQQLMSWGGAGVNYQGPNTPPPDNTLLADKFHIAIGYFTTSDPNEAISFGFPGPEWIDLPVNHWYHVTATWDFDTAQILEASIKDLTVNGPTTTVDVTSRGWFLNGGTANALPTDVRTFAGCAGCATGWDNIRVYKVQTGPTCYANCDSSTTVPFLNVNDFICFQTKFAAGDPYANCDGSTTAPVLNVNDFICFQTKFAAGCSAP